MYKCLDDQRERSFCVVLYIINDYEDELNRRTQNIRNDSNEIDFLA